MHSRPLRIVAVAGGIIGALAAARGVRTQQPAPLVWAPRPVEVAPYTPPMQPHVKRQT